MSTTIKQATTLAAMLAATLTAAALFLGINLLGSAPAHASESPHGTSSKAAVATSYETYKNEANRKCLDNYSDSLHTYRCDSTDEQDWHVTHWADGTVRLKNRESGKCLDDSGGTLDTARCDASEEQSFYVTHWGDGTIRFKNQRSGQCINAASDNDVGSARCDASESQSWY
ncbi:RICIN domain-containing protein [Nocardioides sp. GXZ039]|uniref:RICIN domain-containing protein n=1 Tax=Nocardioides sp. GXZ039 TaxID=3136018 RepID=UPI0030F4A926